MPLDGVLTHVGLASTLYSLVYEEGFEFFLGTDSIEAPGFNSPYGLEPYTYGIEPCGYWTYGTWPRGPCLGGNCWYGTCPYGICPYGICPYGTVPCGTSFF